MRSTCHRQTQASKPSAGGIKRAENWGIPTRVLPHRDYDTVESYSDAISAALVRHAPRGSVSDTTSAQ